MCTSDKAMKSYSIDDLIELFSCSSTTSIKGWKLSNERYTSRWPFIHRAGRRDAAESRSRCDRHCRWLQAMPRARNSLLVGVCVKFTGAAVAAAAEGRRSAGASPGLPGGTASAERASARLSFWRQCDACVFVSCVRWRPRERLGYDVTARHSRRVNRQI